MLIGLAGPRCALRDRAGASEAPSDAYWLERTADEAGAQVLLCLSDALGQQAEECAPSSAGFVGRQVNRPERPYCFLVAADLGWIEPLWAYYPFAGQWDVSPRILIAHPP